MILKQSTPYIRLFTMVTSAGVGVPAITLPANMTVKLAKGTGGLNTAAGTVTEVSSGTGQYYISLTAADVNTPGDLIFYITATGGTGGPPIPTTFVDQVQQQVFTDLVLTGNTGLQTASVVIASNVKINQALNGFQFLMTNAVTNAPMSGLGTGVAATRSLGGTGFLPCANTPTEVASGVYTINLAGADLNNASVALRFTAAGANDNVIVIITQP